VKKILYLTLAVTIILCSCRHGSRNEETAHNGDSRATARFIIEQDDGFTKLTVKDPWQNSRGVELVYYLLPRDTAIPEGMTPDRVIRIPVRSMICMSATHIAMLSAIGATDILVGISGSDLIYDSLVRDGISRGKIHDVGYEGNLNNELIVTLKPDVLMAYGVAAPSAGSMERLSAAGVRVIFNADYLEEHPLARCEWIRLFGLLTGRESIADSIIAAVSDNYRQIARLVSNSNAPRPDVLLGGPWEDVWYISPSNSYTGRLIEDAGGNYIFRDLTGPNSVPFSIESVYRRATEAEIWINPGSAGSLEEMSAADYRLAQLPVFARGEVWNNRRRMTPQGGNDYWESAVVRPDLLLKDLVSIIHPELLPDYKQFYYRRLE